MYLNFKSAIKHSIAITLSTLLLTSTAHAASSCKGQIKQKCDSSNSCSWVDGYKKSNGSSVKGYCRKKPSKGKSTVKTDSKAKDSAKSSLSKAKDTKKQSEKSLQKNKDKLKDKTKKNTTPKAKPTTKDAKKSLKDKTTAIKKTSS